MVMVMVMVMMVVMVRVRVMVMVMVMMMMIWWWWWWWWGWRWRCCCCCCWWWWWWWYDGDGGDDDGEDDDDDDDDDDDYGDDKVGQAVHWLTSPFRSCSPKATVTSTGASRGSTLYRRSKVGIGSIGIKDSIAILHKARHCLPDVESHFLCRYIQAATRPQLTGSRTQATPRHVMWRFGVASLVLISSLP